jgi:hypothetical protein
MYQIFQLGKQTSKTNQIQYCNPNYLERNFVGIKYSETLAQTRSKVDPIG